MVISATQFLTCHLTVLYTDKQSLYLILSPRTNIYFTTANKCRLASVFFFLLINIKGKNTLLMLILLVTVN